MAQIIFKHEYKPFESFSKIKLFEDDKFIQINGNYYGFYLELLIQEPTVKNREELILRAIDKIPLEFAPMSETLLYMIIENCNVNIFKHFITKLPIEINNPKTINKILDKLIKIKKYDLVLFILEHFNIKFFPENNYFQNRYKIFNNVLNEKDLNFIKYLFQEEGLINYSKYHIEYMIENFSKRNENFELNKFLFDELLKLENFKEYLDKSFQYSIYNTNIKYFNYIINHIKFKELIIDDVDFIYESIFSMFYKNSSCRSIYYQTHQSKLIYTLLCKFKEYDVLERILPQIFKEKYYNNRSNDDNYDFSLLSTMLKLPNIIKSLELFLPGIDKTKLHIYIQDNRNNVTRKSLLRYGYYDTINYIMDNFPILIFKWTDSFTIYNILSDLLCNKNMKYLKEFLEKIKNNEIPKIKKISWLNRRIYGSLSFDFLNVITEWENSKKKINLLDKYFDIAPIKHELIYNIFSDEKIQKPSELKAFILKKYVSTYNISDNLFQRYISHIFISILNQDDIELLSLFLRVVKNKFTKHNYCYWNLVVLALDSYSWFSDYINTILEFCPPLKYTTLEIKENIIITIARTYKKNNIYIGLSDNDDTDENYIKYIKLFKMFIKNGIDLNNIKKYGRGLLDLCCISNTIFKALIYSGVDFKKYFFMAIKSRYGVSNLSKDWIKMYILIRRLEIVRHYRNKNQHSKRYRDSVIDLLNRPPSKKKKVLEKGGIMYYKNIDEFNTLQLENGDGIEELENSNLICRYNNPKNISREELSNLNYPIYISQKVDGINFKNIDKDSLYPPLDDSYDNCILDGEYIEELDIYLIFSIRSNSNMDNSHFDDILELIKLHPYTKNLIKLEDIMLGNHLTESKIKLLFYSEINILFNFFYHNKDKKNKWFPKIFYKIIDPENNLNIMSMMEEYQNKIYNQLLGNRNLLTIESKEYIENQKLKMDGIIIYDLNDRNKIRKYKPQHFMTIDTLNPDDGEIYRCYYNPNTNEFEPLEIRKDKKFPNPDNIVVEITNYHKNPYTIKDLIKKETQLPIIQYYQKNTMKDKDSSEFIMEYKYAIGSIINKREIYCSSNILDLGCGYFNNQLWKSDKKIVGVDIEKSIYNYFKISKNKFVNKEFKMFDFRKGWIISFADKFDLCYMNMSIHYAFENQTTIRNFFRQMYKILSYDGKVFITFIDSKELFNNNSENIIRLSGKSYIKNLKNKMEIYYEFRHNNPIFEPQLDYQLVINTFNYYGFELIKDYSSLFYKELENNNWSKILNHTKYLIFEKKNI